MLDPETLVYGLIVAGDPQVSPDGTRIVYGLHSFDAASHRPRKAIWSCLIDGSGQRRLSGPDDDASGARWSPDSRQVSCVFSDGAGSSVVVLSADEPGHSLEVARDERGFGELAWSPDGTNIACTVLVAGDDAGSFARATRRLDYQEDGRGYLGDTRKQLFVLSVADRSMRQLTAVPRDHHGPLWSPDGSMLAVASPDCPDERPQLALIDVATGDRRSASPPDAGVLHWSWSPDGGAIVYAADPDQSLQPDYYLYTVADGETRRITDDPGFVPPMPSPPPVWIDTDHVLVEAQRGGASELVLLDVRAGGVETLERSEARHTNLSVDARMTVAVQAEASPTSCGELSVVDLGTRLRRTVTSHNSDLLASHPPARWERFQVRADGGPIDAWLLKPADFDPTKRYPVVLDVHGGPTGHYGSGFMAVQQCLASNGFLVVYANCRGSSSYGREFARANIRDWGGGDYRDYMTVVDAVLENDFADPERTGIYGYSYGGYMTSWTISQTHRFAAAVCGAPIFDMESYWGTSDVGHRGIEKYAGGPPFREQEWYAERGPSTFAHRATTPTLVIQGEEDHRCPVGQGQQLFVALRRVNCEAELALYPGCSHLFLFDGPPAARHDYLTRILAWFSDRLGHPAERSDTA